MAWSNDNSINLQAHFGGAIYLNDFQAIQDFLTDEARVRAALLRLIEYAQANGVNDYKTFENLLTQLENDMGFSGVVKIQEFLSRDQFFAYVENKETMLDKGAGEKHGFNTHRVQWALIRVFSDFDLSNDAASVFASIPAVLKRQSMYPVFPDSNNMWDALFDREDGTAKNATCPEYFHDKWLNKPAQDDLNFLRGIWR